MSLTSKDFSKTFKSIEWIDDIPFHLYNKLLVPVAMPHSLPEKIDYKAVIEAINNQKALLSYWTSEWDSKKETKWWWIINDTKDYDLDKITSSRGKRNVKKGLKSCEIKTVEPDSFIDLSYEILKENINSYGPNAVVSLPEYTLYRDRIRRLSSYEGTKYWGAFFDGKLIAYSTCFKIDNAVSLGETKSMAQYNKYNANAALFFSICQHYLNEEQVDYVSNGHRNILHQTGIHDYLENIGFRKAYAKLNIAHSPLSSNINKLLPKSIATSAFIKKLFPVQSQKLEAFFKLSSIEKSF